MGWLPDIPWNSNNHQLICGLGLGQPIPIILTPLRRDCSRVSWPALKTKNTQAITGSWRSVRRLDDELLVYRGKHPDYPRLIMHLDVFGCIWSISARPKLCTIVLMVYMFLWYFCGFQTFQPCPAAPSVWRAWPSCLRLLDLTEWNDQQGIHLSARTYGRWLGDRSCNLGNGFCNVGNKLAQ